MKAVNKVFEYIVFTDEKELNDDTEGKTHLLHGEDKS